VDAVISDFEVIPLPGKTLTSSEKWVIGNLNKLMKKAVIRVTLTEVKP